MSYEDYLNEHYRPRTAHQYKLDIKKFCRAMEDPEQACYQDIVNYVGTLRAQQASSGSITRIVCGIKSYYRWLRESGKRSDHPCSHLVLKDSPQPRIRELLQPEELNLLMEESGKIPWEREKERLYYRYQVIVSLLVYQALTVSNINGLELEDLNLEQATLYIRSSETLNPRTLPLHPRQIMLFYHYLEKERPLLLKKESSKLLLTKRGNPESGCSVRRAVARLRHLFPGRDVCALMIRQSVISNLLKSGKDTRVVQVFAGYHQSTSVEKYKQTHLEELKNEILKKHPLG